MVSSQVDSRAAPAGSNNHPGTSPAAWSRGGASLQWTVARLGATQVAQPPGDVFYRVERGDPFVIDANDVSITVTGTCFRVEVIPMKSLVAAAAGAVVASAVLIAVYEGKVSVAPSGAAAVSLVASEQARVRPSGDAVVEKVSAPPPVASAVAPPDRAPDGQLTREQLIARDTVSRQQIAGLQARLQQLHRDAQQKPPDEESSPGDAAGLPPRGKTHDFTPAEQQAMARHCEVRIDMPPLEGDKWKLTPSEGARLHLAEDQQPRVAAAVNKVRDDAIARLRALYLEATGDAGGAQVLAPMTLGQELLHKSLPAEVEAARARVARERAGIDPPPSEPGAGTVPERYFRYMTTIGDAVQHELEPIVGATQAGIIRDRVDGWHQTMNGCKDASDPSSPSSR